MDSLRAAIRCICVSWSPLKQYGHSLADNWQVLSDHNMPSAFIAAMIGSEKTRGQPAQRL